MKKRFLALLCALALCIPALSMAYTCDSCDYEGPFVEVVTGEGIEDGAPGEYYATVCPNCGTPSPVIPPSWRQTGPTIADPPPQSGNTNSDPPVQTENSEQPAAIQREEETKSQETGGAAAPEAPVKFPSAPPEVPAGSDSTENAVQVVPEEPATQPETAQVLPVSRPDPADSQPQAAVNPLPPVPEENPMPEKSNPQLGEASGPESITDEAAVLHPAGNTYIPDGRDLTKYPIFSVFRPSRRLNLEGDPDALAPIPGEKIYPVTPEEGSSILRHMLDGD